ncbi:ceramide-1-phosphate transfer protein-like [Brienomyrus brachyistius]|uniref:ceramide-1-phosphate transfer protein-like n=1 Tax=Brienomyrus brachyistius TaxID=42636 RepID=UPI0020B1DFF8|nr:ceramide-1-phosphate transfer protein-like [Brienomyrus brachyistius]
MKVKIHSEEEETRETDDRGTELNGLSNDLVRECPGQIFQVSRLLTHLGATLSSDSDILLQPYLSCWDELIKFMESLGTVVSFISQQVRKKVTIIRELAQQDAQMRREGEIGREAEGNSYRSVRSMIEAELSRGLVNFRTQTPSGCRTLLRLHRALLWLQLFLQKVGEGPDASGEMPHPSDLCREAYQLTLAHHHSWIAQRAAELAFMAMPDREAMIQLVCVHSQQEAGRVLDRVARALGEVYSRTQNAFEEHGLLDLP